jgi:hypothetical protein
MGRRNINRHRYVDRGVGRNINRDRHVYKGGGASTETGTCIITARVT